MIANKKGALVGALAQHSTRAKYTPTRTDAARDVLRDAVLASGVDAYVGMAILAAADSFAKARARDEFASFMQELDRGAVEVTT